MPVEILDKLERLTYPQNQRVLLWLAHLPYPLFQDYADAAHLLCWEHPLKFCTVCKDPGANMFSTSAKVIESLFGNNTKDSLRLQNTLKQDFFGPFSSEGQFQNRDVPSTDTLTVENLTS